MRFNGKFRQNSISNLRNVDRHLKVRAVLDDHPYCGAPGPFGDCPPSETEQSWQQGRRVIELSVLASGLDNCSSCQMPLRLSACKGETRQGLGLILLILCENAECGVLNSVPCGKRHTSNSGNSNKIWDVNTKLAAGMINAGVGESQINNILAALNIPQISNKALKRRENEIGNAIEKVAENSCDSALTKEKNLLAGTELRDREADADADADADAQVSIDAGWQRRGAGKSYNSLSGHSTAIGKKTGKVLEFGVCKKRCRTCDVANRLKKVAKNHLCRKNWSGSAKSMEPFIAVDLLCKLKNKGFNVNKITGDDDTTTLARARKSISSTIVKESDKNHIMKNFGNSLYNLKEKHKKLSARVIRYLQKCFSYALSQNKGNPSSLRERLLSIVPHAFGSHGSCDKQWCGYLTDPESYRHKTLPYGKNLQGEDLQKDLTDIFANLCSDSKISKLINLDCSNANENLNQLISTKAPKNHHFSDSASLDYRVAAAVAQKNEGHSYLLQVNESMGLSPGKFTTTRTKILDRKKFENFKRGKTREGKLRRLAMKATRYAGEENCLVHEGDMYVSNGDMDVPVDQQDIEEVPRAPLIPLPPTSTDATIGNNPVVVFDVETTGLGIDDSIIQISCQSNTNKTFEQFMFPEKGYITHQISRLTSIEMRSNIMYCNNVAVNAVSQKRGITSFLDWIGGKAILVAHNAQFDARMLVKTCEKYDLFSLLLEKVAAFSDTLPAFKELYPGRTTYKQVDLVRDLLNKTYDAHNATSDVITLKELIELFTKDILVKFSFSVSSVQLKIILLRNRKLNLPSYDGLLKKKCISKNMAEKLASSGLKGNHLNLAYERKGLDGVMDILKGRIKMVQKIALKICDGFK